MRSVFAALICGVLFYFYQYIIRVFPNVMSSDIFREFHVNAEQFTTLAFISSMIYGLIQIPIGILLDRINTRKIGLLAILLCIGGALLFAWAKDFAILQTSRFITGIGSAIALPLTLKIINSKFEGPQRSFLSGFTLTVGVLGGFSSGYIMSAFINIYDWRVAVTIVAISGFIIFLGLFVFLPDLTKDGTEGVNFFKKLIEGIKGLRHLMNRNILYYALMSGVIYMPTVIFGDLLGGMFLQSKLGISHETATKMSLNLYIGVGIGSLIIPWFAEKIGKMNFIMSFSVLMITSLFCVILFVPKIDTDILYWIIIFIGFFCGSEMICFNAALNIVPQNMAALTVGIINSFSIIFGGVCQQLVGTLLNITWDGTHSKSGEIIYSLNDYVTAISLIPAFSMFCFALSLLFTMKERKNGR